MWPTEVQKKKEHCCMAKLRNMATVITQSFVHLQSKGSPDGTKGKTSNVCLRCNIKTMTKHINVCVYTNYLHRFTLAETAQNSYR